MGGVPIAKLKVAELKAELEARELSKTGKKDELVARLISFMEVNECSEPSSENSSRTDTPNAEVSSCGQSKGKRCWRLLRKTRKRLRGKQLKRPPRRRNREERKKRKKQRGREKQRR